MNTKLFIHLFSGIVIVKSLLLPAPGPVAVANVAMERSDDMKTIVVGSISAVSQRLTSRWHYEKSEPQK